MNSILFLLAAAAMLCAVAGRRQASLLVFLAGLALAVVWLRHHATSALPLEF